MRRLLQNRRGADIRVFEHDGRYYRATYGRFPDGNLAEIFLDCGKPDSTLQQHADDAAVLTSLLLQNNVPARVIRRSIAGPIRKALDIWLEVST
jgi:hypothetical protein